MSRQPRFTMRCSSTLLDRIAANCSVERPTIVELQALWKRKMQFRLEFPAKTSVFKETYDI